MSDNRLNGFTPVGMDGSLLGHPGSGAPHLTEAETNALAMLRDVIQGKVDGNVVRPFRGIVDGVPSVVLMAERVAPDGLEVTPLAMLIDEAIWDRLGMPLDPQHRPYRQRLIEMVQWLADHEDELHDVGTAEDAVDAFLGGLGTVHDLGEVQREVPTPEVVHDLMMLVETEVPGAVPSADWIRVYWGDNVRTEVARWAMAIHLVASDNDDVEIPPLPLVLQDRWWEHLSDEQQGMYGGLIDSRVRLLGDSYGNATEYVRKHQRMEVLGD